MIAFNLETVKDAEKLVKLCERYKDDCSIDVIYNKYIVDGCSLLGVMSLVGHFVGIEVIDKSGNESIAAKEFAEEIRKIM